MSTDVVIATAALVGRAGAAGFELAWTCPHVPDEPDGHHCPDVTWHASASYRGHRVITDQHRSPAKAALALAERLLTGATCRCTKPVTLADGRPGCRWRLVGQAWQPGCNAAPLRMPAGTRGDHAAMQRALDTRRRAAR